MKFIWDQPKANANLRKHGVSFDEAITVSRDLLSATVDDPDHSALEQRSLTIGYDDTGRLLVISHAERGTMVRIISARLTTPRERRRHEIQATEDH